MGILQAGISSVWDICWRYGQRLSREKAKLVFAGHENEKGVNGG